MARITLETLGGLVRERRGSKGLRELAKDISISTATLSRVENGHVPDLDTFRRICKWLDLDPGEVLGMSSRKGTDRAVAQVNFRKDSTVSPESAKHLGVLILAVQKAIQAKQELDAL